jgi:hypothetical protein
MTSIDLGITLTTAQRNAWNLIRPILKTYLVKIFRIYRAASDEKKAELRAHNPVLDAVIDMLGEG